MAFRSEEEEDDLFDQVTAMADRMGLKGPKRQEYIHDHMTQGGYEMVQTRESYQRIRQDESDDSGRGGTKSWFGSSAGTRRGGGRSRDDDDQY
jgi:hypothetical protein